MSKNPQQDTQIDAARDAILSDSLPAFESSEEFTGIKITDRKKVAGGVPAVIASMKQAIGQMGVIRSAQTLLKLNQVGGYDCSSCAWQTPMITDKLQNSARMAQKPPPMKRHLRASRLSFLKNGVWPIYRKNRITGLGSAGA